ncbi:hypothetical protein FANTH_14790 [Fusarium anthophilum]|uniref:DUF7732 domain-containing protein n=1 Tax=Fusarium anthophilum TaxID=48485 RepID=A0A8H4YG02_9HYPO|nr:hypothetical protein FANTH_14790 [Fusarium anthophilum]
MKPNFALLLLTLIPSVVASVIDVTRGINLFKDESSSDQYELYKRRGGGKGGWRGGSISRGSSAGPSSNSGSSRGRSPQPSFSGGRYYPGGSTTSYSAGAVSPGGITPYMIDGAALMFWPGTWVDGAYVYPYNHTHQYHNETSDKDEVRDLLCGCSRYQHCTCDDNNSVQYFNELIGNGSYGALNKSIVTVAEVNGTVAILINGTLSNDTDLPDGKVSGSVITRSMVGTSHYVIVAAIVIAAVIVA